MAIKIRGRSTLHTDKSMLEGKEQIVEGRRSRGGGVDWFDLAQHVDWWWRVLENAQWTSVYVELREFE
jgi:hypothetical protein